MAKPRDTHKIKIDPLFLLPEGAEDLFVYSRESATDGEVDVNVEILGTGLDDSEIGSKDQTEDTLGVPDTFSIVSQTVRRGSGGIMVIDVVLSIDDVPGASDYDVQVIK